ncbi:hypothetical protein EMCRGX_G029435 [Ephydatia muelleri]
MNSELTPLYDQRAHTTLRPASSHHSMTSELTPLYDQQAHTTLRPVEFTPLYDQRTHTTLRPASSHHFTTSKLTPLYKQRAYTTLRPSALTSDLSPLALAMAQRPVLLPDPFDGEKTSWPEWETHFKHVAVFNKWESADEKLKWLRVRLTGKALAAFSRCSEDVRNDYGECMKALAKRFNPDSKREVYVAELHSRNRRKEEDWATYADILKGLADKAYPDLEEAARERLALNQFLGELDKPQVAFGVRQGRPKSLDEAVSLTIELESYIGGSHGKPARVNFSQVDAELPNASASTTVAEEQECSGVLAVTLQSINERLQRLELRLKNTTRKLQTLGGRGQLPEGQPIMAQNDLIVSVLSSPVVLVKKKDESVRFCVDYRKVNSVTRKDAYPLPRVDDTLDTLAGSRLFTTLDLASGYWQVEVAEEDQPKTAFTTPEGLFQFRVMPFGLCNAPATFQRLMDRVLGGLKWSSCLVYLDDIIIVGTSFSEHLRNLAGVLQRLRQAGLKLKPSKCKWCQKSVTFLGHIVSEEGVAADPSKTAIVAGWPPPQSKREMQQFLGLANYYRKFVKNFAAIAKPLHRLTEKNTDFKWTVKYYSRRFVLDTDASDIGIGAVLSQEDATGSEVVIAYASHTLSRPEQRYCVTRKELLAAVEFIHHFRQYLLGREFTLRTDHSSLVWLRNFKEPESQLARWLEKLQEYSFSVVHRQGTKHGNADALSRVPCRQCGRESHETTPKGDVIEGSVTSLPCTSYTPQWIRQQQLDDCSIRPVYQALESKLMLSADEVKPWSRESRLLWQQHTSLYLKDGVLWRRVLGGGEGKLQLVVPAKLRQDILRSLHEGALSAHLGEEKMRNLLKERFYWPSCADDVSEWCSCCAVCCSRKTHVPKRRAGLQTLQVGYPLQMVCVDLLGPLPETETGSRYVLVAVDHFTKWAEAYRIPNQEAATVARKLVDEMFCWFSPPEQLHSDQGRQFESELVKEVCKLLEIKKTHTTPYHPQCNGIVERFNRTLLGMLATTVDSYPSSWEQNIRRFFLMFGRQVKLPVDLMYGTTQGKETAVIEYVKNLKDGLLEAYALVRDRCETEHKRQKSIYDRKVHGEPYSEGDLVWLYTPAVPSGQSRKLHRPWKGPYKVVERLGDATYKLQADEVVLPTPKPGEQCELLEEDEDYAAPVAPPNELPAAGPGDQPVPQRRYPDRNRRQPDRYGPFIKH